MARLRDVLHAADPLRFGVPPAEERRLRARREAVVGAFARRETRPELRAPVLRDVPAVAPRLVLRRVAMAAVIIAAVVTAGLGVWRYGATPALAAVRFEIRLAEDAPARGLREAPVGADPRIVYLHDAVVVSNDHIASTQVIAGPAADRFAVEVVFTPEGAQRMLQATSAHVGRPVALLVDGLVVMAPTVRSAIGDRALLTGRYTRAAAERIAAGILRR